MGQILEGRLYIASAVQANNWELLTSLKVTHIVNCSRSCNFDGTGTNPFSAWYDVGCSIVQLGSFVSLLQTLFGKCCSTNLKWHSTSGSITVAVASPTMPRSYYVSFFGKQFVLNKSSMSIVVMGYMIHLFKVIDTPAHLSFAQ